MDCDQVKELLDAYALGAAEPEEAAALEEHMEDCARCWHSLNEAQRAAAAIALSSNLCRAPESLRRNILAEIEGMQHPAEPRLLERVRRLWPAGVGLLAATAAASLAVALFLQMELSDLRSENDRLTAEVESADARLAEQQQVMALLSAPDAQQIRLEPTDPASSAAAVYHWSGSARAGALTCNHLPPLQEGQVYQVWFLTESESYPAGRFRSWDGIGQLSVALEDLPERPVAIGVSIEYSEGVGEPSEMFLIAELQQ
jgi:cell division protein FtsB